MPRGTNRAASTEDTANVSTEDTTAVAIPEPNYDDNALRTITSFADAINLAGETFGTVEDASDVLGDGFRLLKEGDGKTQLCGKPLMLLEWNFYTSTEFGGEFAAIRLVSQEPNGSIGKWVVNDGSTGIAKTLKEYTERTGGKRGGLMVRNGFRESTYPFCNDCRMAVKDNHKEDEPTHQVGRGRTYYIDTSA